MAGGFNLDIAQDDALRTLADLPFYTSGRYPKAQYVGRCRGETVEWLSSRELFDRIRDVALGLEALGLAAGDRIALASESRPEWLVVDLAALSIGRGGGAGLPDADRGAGGRRNGRRGRADGRRLGRGRSSRSSPRPGRRCRRSRR